MLKAPTPGPRSSSGSRSRRMRSIYGPNWRIRREELAQRSRAKDEAPSPGRHRAAPTREADSAVVDLMFRMPWSRPSLSVEDVRHYGRMPAWLKKVVASSAAPRPLPGTEEPLSIMNPHDCEVQNAQEVENSLETAVRIELCSHLSIQAAICKINDLLACRRRLFLLHWGNTGNSEEVAG